MRSLLALALAAFALAGCAKFPDGGGAEGFTRLVFRFRTQNPVNPDYKYFVAIRTIRTGDTQVDANGPIPVVTTGSKNGFVEGQPTNYVRFAPGLALEDYEVHRFATQAEAPDPSDDNPINLGVDPINGSVLVGINPLTEGNDPNVLGFDTTTQDLARNRDPEEARSIIAIQFNILTMSDLALSGVGNRVMDALGNTSGQNNTSFNSYRRINIVTGGTYRNTDQSPIDQEREGDTYNGTLPAIDIVDWTVEVRID